MAPCHFRSLLAISFQGIQTSRPSMGAVRLVTTGGPSLCSCAEETFVRTQGIKGGVCRFRIDWGSHCILCLHLR